MAQLEQIALESEEDPEMAHLKADAVLLEYINNTKITEAYDSVVKFFGRGENV